MNNIFKKLLNIKMKFPKLYKTTDNERVWQIWTDDNRVYETYGIVGGKMVEPGDGTECEGTNVGRKNERTPEEQAIFNATSKWNSKIDKGYRPKSEAGLEMMKEMQVHKKQFGTHTLGGEKRDINDLYIVDELPEHHRTLIMKGPDYKGKHDISAGGYVQPKYDGLRCKGSSNGKMGVITSSGANQFPHLRHIKDALKYELRRYKKVTGIDLCLDGELYAHEIVIDGKRITKDLFTKFITPICNVRNKRPHAEESQIKYVIFDIHNNDPQSDRIETLKDFFYGVTHDCLEMAPTKYVEDKEKMEVYMEKFIKANYEGLIFRYCDQPYIEKKKTGLNAPVFKYKKMQDAEFKITDIEKGKGRAKDRIIWVCETKDGSEFRATQDGSTEYCMDLYSKRKTLIGKMLTVKFQDYSKSGIPRFPIAKSIRDYE
jgi:ATP dependent DNA ligase domain/DNA ligase OB-like domain